MIPHMDPRRLALLLELSRLGSMREVAEELGVTTSTVSQQLAVLAREAGTPLLERVGRRVRLTPAGRRLADHAVTILAALEAARVDLDPAAAPSGVVRVAAYATAVRQVLLPVVHTLADEHPDVTLRIAEYEPTEALDRLAADDVDLALVYDYNLAPAVIDPATSVSPLGETRWALGVRRTAAPPGAATHPSAPRLFARYRETDWIGNSRHTGDEQVIRAVAAEAGFAPRLSHRADSLELVEDLISAGLGVGLLPVGWPAADDVRLLPLRDPEVVQRSFALTRLGREAWPPLALVQRLMSSLLAHPSHLHRAPPL